MKSIIENKRLTQKKGSDFRYFEILEDGVLFEYKNEGNYLKYKIPFDDIEFNEIINNKKPNRNEIILFSSVILNISLLLFILMNNQITKPTLSAILFGIIGSISFWGAKIFKKESIKFLEGRQNLSFFTRKKMKNQ
jgi:amino acid permease